MNTNFSREVVFSDDAAMGRAGMSRRDFIKGVIATGASISAMGYVFGGCAGDKRQHARRARLSGLFLSM